MLNLEHLFCTNKAASLSYSILLKQGVFAVCLHHKRSRP